MSENAKNITELIMLSADTDLKNDIAETTNVADEYPEIVKRLMTRIENARFELGDCDRIGKGARFYDAQPKRPDIDNYNAWLTKQKKQ